MLPNPKQLPLEYADLNEMSTASRGVSVMYGRRSDGSLIALQVDDNGVLASSAVFSGTVDVGTVVVSSGTVSIAGSSNSYYLDQGVTALTTAYQHFVFGFTSVSITIINDDQNDTLTFSFNGSAVHGTIQPGETFVMDNRAQAGIYLKSSSAGASYRVMAY